MESHLFKTFIEPGWFEFLKPFLESEAFDEIWARLMEDKKERIPLPYYTQMFNAFKYCAYNNLKVIILGRAPYYSLHGGQPVANGLAFGTDRNFTPENLKVIIEEVERDIYTTYYPDEEPISMNFETFLDNEDNSLKRWAAQGILLLNAALTTRIGEPASHLDLWKPFTEYVLSNLNEQDKRLVFLLWGRHANEFAGLINSKNYCFSAPYPFPKEKGHKDSFIGCSHFSKTNEVLGKIYNPASNIKW